MVLVESCMKSCLSIFLIGPCSYETTHLSHMKVFNSFQNMTVTKQRTVNGINRCCIRSKFLRHTQKKGFLKISFGTPSYIKLFQTLQ